MIALARVAKNLTSSSEIAVTLGKLIKVPHITNSISVMSSELQNAGIISETIDEVVDLTQSDSDIEDEVEGEVNKILASVTKDLNKGNYPTHFYPLISPKNPYLFEFLRYRRAGSTYLKCHAGRSSRGCEAHKRLR